MSWRQPYDVACPVCLVGPGRLCREARGADIETLTPKAIRRFDDAGILQTAPTHHTRRMTASLRGKKVPLA